MADGNYSGSGVATVKSSTTVEVDTEPPFSSVREAVSLFGEKLLLAGRASSAAEDKIIREVPTEPTQPGRKHGPTSIESELNQTKQKLEKAKEESIVMAKNLFSLREELEMTKKELQNLKDHQELKEDLEDLKCVEVPFDNARRGGGGGGGMTNDEIGFVRRSRTVKFTHPTLCDIIISDDDCGNQAYSSFHNVREAHKGKKKMMLFNLPLIGGMFAKRKNKYYHEI